MRRVISDFYIQVCKQCRFDYQLRHSSPLKVNCSRSIGPVPSVHVLIVLKQLDQNPYHSKLLCVTI